MGYEAPSALMEFQVKSGFKTYNAHFRGGADWEPMYFVMPNREAVEGFLAALETVREQVAKEEEPPDDEDREANVVKVATVRFEQHNDLFPKVEEVVLATGALRRVLP